MPLPQVCGDTLRHYIFIRLERIQIFRAHLCRDLEADMQQLPEAGVVCRVLRVVAQGRSVLLAGPAVHLRDCRQLTIVDVDYGGVRRGELIFVCQRLRVDLFGNLEAGSVHDSARPITSSSQLVPAVFR